VSGYDLGGPRLSAALVGHIRAMIRDEVAALVPREQYGTVAEVDAGARRASVYLDGADIPSPGFAYAAEAALHAGDRVLVRRTSDGDRLVLLDLTPVADSRIVSGYVEMTTPTTTTSATLEDIAGAVVTVTTFIPCELAVWMTVHDSADGTCDLGLAVSIGGTDYDESVVHLTATTEGNHSLNHRSPELPAGTWTVQGRFRRGSGAATPGVDRADLLVMAMQTRRV
jgi:hypothetical protein